MKTFAEILRRDRDAETVVSRRDRRNAEHRCSKAQIEVQWLCTQQLARYVAYLEACSQLVASGEMHPLQHPLASYYAERDRAKLLAPHPAALAHPLAHA